MDIMHNFFYVFNILQDVNILQSLVRFYAVEFQRRSTFIVTMNFKDLDSSGLWLRELEELALYTNSNLKYIDDDLTSFMLFQGEQGIMISASESNLKVHKSVFDLFSFLPSEIIKVTLQHGYECVGYLHSRDHDMAHGKNIKSNSDILCSWANLEFLKSINYTEVEKIVVTGGTFLLNEPVRSLGNTAEKNGIICENMHSARMSNAGDFKVKFLAIFDEFCKIKEIQGDQIYLRPHPAGQYTLKTNHSLASNVVIENDPIYKLNLNKYSYCISPPSSIIIDMIYSNVPVAVWGDPDGLMDLGNYRGLHVVNTLIDFLEFSIDSIKNKEKYLQLQQKFVLNSGIIFSAEYAKKMYRDIANINHTQISKADTCISIKQNTIERILFIFSGYEATQQACIMRPLSKLFESGEFVFEVITELQFDKKLTPNNLNVERYVNDIFVEFNPTLIVFSRYGGEMADLFLSLSNKFKIPTVYHIDDDLLNVPETLGSNKFKFHNNPTRLTRIEKLLNEVDVVYCSTEYLRNSLSKNILNSNIYSGTINASGSIFKKNQSLDVKRIGYMGVGHGRDFELVAPAISEYLKQFPDVIFEIFGTIEIPEVLHDYKNRIVIHPKTSSYENFLLKLSSLNWSIGICPLEDNNFNKCKSNIKWIEYTSACIAVIASRGFAYDDCCSNGAGCLASNNDEWLMHLISLTVDSDFRANIIEKAQEKLQNEYSLSVHEEQILNVFSFAKSISVNKNNKFKYDEEILNTFYDNYKNHPFDFFVRKRDYAEIKQRFITEFNHSKELNLSNSWMGRLVFLLEADLDLIRDTLEMLKFQTNRKFGVVIISNEPIGSDLLDYVGLFYSEVDFKISFATPNLDNVQWLSDSDYLIPIGRGDIIHPSLGYNILIVLISNTNNHKSAIDIFCWNYVLFCPDDVLKTKFVRLPLNKNISLINSEVFARSIAIKVDVYRKIKDVDFVNSTNDFLRVSADFNLRWYNFSEFLSIYSKYELQFGLSNLSDNKLRSIYSSILYHNDLDFANYDQNLCSNLGQPRFIPNAKVNGISVIILYKDKAQLTFNCLSSVIKQITNTWIEIVLVNNNSSDQENKLLKYLILNSYGENNSIKFVNYPYAFNHSRQCNLGVEASSGQVLVFLNNDASFISNDAIQTMASWAVLPIVATVGCHVVDSNGHLISSGLRLRQNIGFEFNSFIEESKDELLSSGLKEVCGNTFACSTITREKYVAIGRLDEVSFPIGYNDVDFCMRANSLNFTHLICGWIKVFHQPGTSRGRSDEMVQKSLLRSKFQSTLKILQFQLEFDDFMIKMFLK